MTVHACACSLPTVWFWRCCSPPGYPHHRVLSGLHLQHGLLPAPVGPQPGPCTYVWRRLKDCSLTHTCSASGFWLNSVCFCRAVRGAVVHGDAPGSVLPERGRLFRFVNHLCSLCHAHRCHSAGHGGTVCFPARPAFALVRNSSCLYAALKWHVLMSVNDGMENSIPGVPEC